jgi:hypothetical protein
MNIDAARKWIVVASLIITGCQLIFLICAPAVGYPIEYPKNVELIRVVSPVFLGYLGSATHFVFNNPKSEVQIRDKFLSILVKGPIIIYILVVSSALLSFGYSNRENAEIGTGMSVNDLSTTISFALGVLAATTGVITSYLFGSPARSRVNSKSDSSAA